MASRFPVLVAKFFKRSRDDSSVVDPKTPNSLIFWRTQEGEGHIWFK